MFSSPAQVSTADISELNLGNIEVDAGAIDIITDQSPVEVTPTEELPIEESTAQ